MGCPVHIWAPMMASLVPFARVGRDRVRAMRLRSKPAAAPGQRVVRRFAPIGTQAARPEGEPAAAE